MDIDSDTLKLKYVVVKNGLAYGDASVYTIVVSSSIDLSELRNAIQADCAPLLNGVTKGALEVYKASLSPAESKALLHKLKTGDGIAKDEWKTSLLDDLDLLSDKFTEQPNKRAIHLIVDCTNAGELRATLRSR
jgi:Crinkler effector protein N-terminal domain